MRIARTALSLTIATALVACGGGGSGGGRDNPPPITGGPGAGDAPTPTPSSAACDLASRQRFVFEQLDEFYLFPDLLDRSVNPADFSTVQDYIDALVAPARAQSRDRFFTFITSIEEENAFFNSGASAGFGIRLGYDTSADRVFVLEAFENAPAFPRGFDRGTELLAVGPNTANLTPISQLMASGGPQAVVDALGPSDPGVTRAFRIRSRGGEETTVTVTKAEFEIDPISDRYGARVLNVGGERIGYVMLRTFIGTAEDELRDAFADFRAAGVDEVVVDFRYNGGGLVRVAELMGDLLDGQFDGQVFSRTEFRASLSSENEVRRFDRQPQSIAAQKVAFIGFGGTASASELVINSFIPYLGNDMALVGGNTFGKPVGQIGIDRAQCDDRLRILAFQTVNADGQGEYFTGLANVVPQTCRAFDDIANQLGDPNENSLATSLGFIQGQSCTPIAARAGEQRARRASPQKLVLQPVRPTIAQREVPGLY